MNGPTTPIVEVARKLTEAQRRVLVRGLGGSDTILTLHALRKRGLMSVRHADPDPKTGGWRLTEIGHQVAAHLLSTQVPGPIPNERGDE